MITPEGSGPKEGPGRRLPMALIGGAALLILAGLIAVGRLATPEEPIASAETTTTTTTPDEIPSPIDVENFTVAQIATGEPLDWALSMAVDEHRPLALLEHDGLLYLFSDSGADEPGGLRAWRSGDGADWFDLGEVIPADHAVTNVDSTIQGLVATSNRLTDDALVVWESADGDTWTSSEISVAGERDFFVDVATAAGGNETTLVVASNTRYDRERLLEERLLAVGVELDLSDLAWNLRWAGEAGHELIVRGPLGIPILEQPIDELALSDEEREELLSELFDPLGSDIWVRGEDGRWMLTTIDDARRIDSILPSAEGRLVAYGAGASGGVAKTTSDGMEWESGNSSIVPREIEEWNDGLVGGVNTPDLMISGDGLTWRAAGLSERFPSQMGWSPSTLGAGEGGAAMLVRGSRPLPVLPEPTIQELTAEDGSTFTVDANGPGFQVFSSDGQQRWALDGSTVTDEAISIDPAEQTITLRDADSGEDLAVFTFAEIERVERAHAMSTLLYQLSEALAFTEDGEEWVIQDMAPEIGERASISLLEVTASRIVGVVRSTVDSFFGDGPPGFEIWSAPLP